MFRYLLLLLTVVLALIATHGVRAAEPLTARELAARIDVLLDAHWRDQGIQPAPRADDAEFLRRAFLDLTGRIPRVADVRGFLEDESPNKRARLLDRLLDDPRFDLHFAQTWRAELLPETAADRGAGVFRAGFERWLRERSRSRVAYDALVRELLTVPIAQEGAGLEPVLRDPSRANPLAFYAVKEAKPENLAASVSRTFLGLRMECAQCHNHPFATWTQEQFWQQAAFFASVRQQSAGMFAPLVESTLVHEVAPAEQGITHQAMYLDGSTPAWSADARPRALLADWITSRDNPYFARAGANRVWAQLFGRGIVEPVDDFRDDNPPEHPELLNLLADSYAAAGFDIRYLMRAICLTEAYQRTSARTDSSQDRTTLPARMPLKALTGEQFFDSIALATGYDERQDKGAARRQMSVRFSRGAESVEPETSVQQALTLLNGEFTNWAASAEHCPTLVALSATPGLTTQDRVEGLYLATLGRLPSQPERERIDALFASSPDAASGELLADLFWALLSSAEFRMNH
jgi:hypothetical protein